MSLEFGVIDHIDRPQNAPIHEVFEKRLQQVARFDQDGFYGYHLTEHHFTPHGLAPSPITFLAAAAAVTNNIRLIPTVFVLPTYHPLRLAEEICMLDQISRGRVEFGVGRGIVPHELALFGIHPLEAPDIMKETFDVLMSALTQESVTHRGHYYKFFSVPMELRPFQTPHPPLWNTSASADAMRAAGREGSNIMVMKHPDDCKVMLRAYMSGWRETHKGNHPLPKLALTRHIFVSRSQRTAEERGHFGFNGWYRSHSAMWKRFDSSRGEGDSSHYVRNRALVFGTPEFVAEELSEQLKAAGDINYLVPRFTFGDLFHEECMESYDLFRTEVMPHLKQRAIAA
jgi:alkanesulfonate monooxygenase SsuD/methylene tetrahydromethanopterin reductase-like flavin-dependent oxidoreductase (luciferase family)